METIGVKPVVSVVKFIIMYAIASQWKSYVRYSAC